MMVVVSSRFCQRARYAPGPGSVSAVTVGRREGSLSLLRESGLADLELGREFDLLLGRR